MNFKQQKRTLLFGTILTLIISSAIFTYFIHHNYESTKIQLIEEKLKGDAKSILPHLYHSGNFAWFRDSLEQYQKLGLKCLSVIGLDGRLIWGDTPCDLKVEAKNYLDQKVFDISYNLPKLTTIGSIKANAASFTIFFIVVCLFLVIAFKVLSIINRRHLETLVQIEHVKGINEANEKILRVTKTLSHNLKSPLAALKALNELASDHLSEDERELLESIQSNIDSMATRLIEQDMDEAPVSIVNLSDVLEDIVEVKRLEYGKNQFVEIRPIIEKNILSLVNKDEFSSIISNIVNNSVEAARENSFIVIDIVMNTKNKELFIEVKDNGKGISREEITNLFEYGSTTKELGKGCGLFHAKNLLTAWNGSIEIDSDLNSGTTVSIKLPLCQSAKEIVLIDDEPLNILSWKGMAKKNNIGFCGYTDPVKFFENLPEEKNNTMIYVDYDLAGIDGVSVIKKIKRLGYSNVFLATGHSEHIESGIAQVGKEFPL